MIAARAARATRAACVGGVLAIVLSSSPAAHAEPRPCSPLLEPAQVSVRESGFDISRAACASARYQLGARSFALIDTPGYYGTLAGSIFFDWSTVHLSGFELGLGARLLDARFVQSAVLPMAELSAGPLRAWALRPRDTTILGWSATVAHSLLIDIPYTNFSLDEGSMSATPALLVTLRPTSDLHWHNRVAALLWAVWPESGPDRRLALALSSDAALRVASWLSMTAGLEVQGGWYGLGLDHALVRGGVRFGWAEEHAIEISGGSAPLGEERADLTLFIGYRFSPRARATKSFWRPPTLRAADAGK